MEDKEYLESVEKEVVENADANIVRFGGTIVSKFEGQKTIVVTLAINTWRGPKSGMVTDYPQVVFFKNGKNESPINDYLVKDKIMVEGHVSSTLRLRERGEFVHMQQIVGDQVKPMEVLYPNQFGDYLGNSVDVPMNLIYLKGTVERVDPITNRVRNIWVATANDEAVNRVSVSAFGNLAESVKTGARVEVYARMTTRKREGKEGEKPHFYYTVAATKIEKA